MSKIIIIFGATGAQGGSEFVLRGITRNESSPVAQGLIKQGVEVRSADMTSKPSIVKAIEASHTIFLVTIPNFTNPEADDELVQGKNVVDAAKEAGVQHLIFSSLLDVTKISGGRLKQVLHFDRKAHVEQYIRDIGVSSSFILAGYFMSNYTALGMIRKGDDDVYTLAYPVTKNAQFPLIDAGNDLGKFVVAAIVEHPKSLGTQPLAAVDYYTPDRIVQEFTEVTGKETRFVEIDQDTYKAFLPAQLADEMLENHLLLESPGYFGGQSLEPSIALVEKAGMKLTTWKDFLAENASFF